MTTFDLDAIKERRALIGPGWDMGYDEADLDASTPPEPIAVGYFDAMGEFEPYLELSADAPDGDVVRFAEAAPRDIDALITELARVKAVLKAAYNAPRDKVKDVLVLEMLNNDGYGPHPI